MGHMEMKRLKCSYADKYKAIYPPRCGCETCWNKWLSIGRAKANKLARIRKDSSNERKGKV